MESKQRCEWVNEKNHLYVNYHDTEWGQPLRDDQKLFELLCLEGAQAGITWEQVLNKREDYKKAFWNFDPKILAKKSYKELLEVMSVSNVIKNKLKTEGLKKNAIAYLAIVAEHGSFSEYVWSFVNNEPIINSWASYYMAPTQTEESQALSKGLKKYGFTFTGPVICYAFMQAAGLVSDHELDCFKCTVKSPNNLFVMVDKK
jgi:DNA-3-methyladenine glycosylase I